jgi:Cu/Ag efflux protein CusF
MNDRWAVIAYAHTLSGHRGPHVVSEHPELKPKPKFVTGEGIVIALRPEKQQIVLEHGEIKGFMEAMTMGYKTNPTSLLNSVIIAGGNSNLTNPLWEQIRDHQHGFAGVLAFDSARFDLTDGGVDVSQVTSAWTETGVTYGTRPTFLSALATGVPITTAKQWVTVDVTQLVQDWVTGVAPNFGLQISASAGAPSTSLKITLGVHSVSDGCEAAPATIRRAHAVHPISALQTEYSLWSRDPEDELIPTVRELGIGYVAYSPLGRGFLTGQLRRFEDLPPDDWRRHRPRFQGENFQKNLELVERVKEIAATKQVTPAQLALAWLLAQGIVPIPGTKRRKNLEENVAALGITLTREDLERINEAAPKGAASGARYEDMSVVDR